MFSQTSLRSKIQLELIFVEHSQVLPRLRGAQGLEFSFVLPNFVNTAPLKRTVLYVATQRKRSKMSRAAVVVVVRRARPRLLERRCCLPLLLLLLLFVLCSLQRSFRCPSLGGCVENFGEDFEKSRFEGSRSLGNTWEGSKQSN